MFHFAGRWVPFISMVCLFSMQHQTNHALLSIPCESESIEMEWHIQAEVCEHSTDHHTLWFRFICELSWAELSWVELSGCINAVLHCVDRYVCRVEHWFCVRWLQLYSLYICVYAFWLCHDPRIVHVYCKQCDQWKWQTPTAEAKPIHNYLSASKRNGK